MLILSEELLRQIEAEAEAAYPNECCGILFGKYGGDAKTVSRIRRADNSREAEEQYHRFRITPEEMLRAEREARCAGEDIVGFYHSHPDAPAIPSEYDRSHALPIYSYIIVSTLSGKAADLTCHTLDENREYRVFRAEAVSRTAKE